MRHRDKPTTTAQTDGAAGFSLLELMVALTIFLVVSSAAFDLFSVHEAAYSQQQMINGLNISLRNALTQMQLDLVNAGTGVTVGPDIPSWPIGVTVTNGSGAGCDPTTTQSYIASCFDSFSVIQVDNSAPAVHPAVSGANCVSTTSSTFFVDAASGLSLSSTAALFHSGDQLLFLKSDGSQMTTAVLTKDGQVTGSKVKLQHNPTGANGINNSANDLLGISLNSNNKLGDTFCSSDWVLKLSPLSYSVDVSNSSDPQLMRNTGGTSTVVADQVIGFKVGVALFNDDTSSGTDTYNYDASSYGYDYTRIRAVRVWVVVRSQPGINPADKFMNTFDHGNYHVLGGSVVVNPRNLSMKD
jgi:prepilin-type N-terminal cleavage/methylation domain-containing protein